MENLDTILTIFASITTLLVYWESYKRNPKDKKVNIKAITIHLFLIIIPISIIAYYTYGIKKSPTTFEFIVIILKYFWIGICIRWIIDRYILKSRLNED